MYADVDESSWTDRHTSELAALYQDEWWTRGRSREDVAAMLDAPGSCLYGVLDGPDGRLAAFARVLTDGVFKALIFDLIVGSEHRGQGLGARLMRRIENDPRLARVRHLELYCLPELEPFYERHGFSAEVGGVRLMRRQRTVS